MKLFTQRRKGFAVLISLALFALIMTACGAGGGTTPPSAPAAPVNGKGCTKVGILLPETATSARWDGQDRPLLIKDLGAIVGSQNVDYNNAQGSAATQQSQAEADLTKGDCILVLAPSDSVASAAIVAKAKAQNVPVISYDRLIQSNDLAAYVSFDGVAVGAQQGGYIADHYADFTKSGKNVVMINGAMTDNNALLFAQGAHSKLDPLFTSGALKKVYEQFTPNWDNATAQTEMEAALTANHNNIQIAYVANDGMANSVIAALKAQKLNGKILVTGQDATVAGIHNILAGDQSMTVYKAIAKEASATADTVKALIAGTGLAALTNGVTVKNANGVAIPSILEAPVAVDKTNIATTVIADGFVAKADVCAGIPAGTDGVC
jgi:D-xylose transport system substrate-binding protein